MLHRAADWFALDFETATSARASACAVGLVGIADGRVVLREHLLIRPPENRYEPVNSAIHGIGPGDTERAPDFATAWQQLSDAIGDRLVLMHNASFDVGVVRAECRRTRLLAPDMRYACTLVMSRRCWPGLPSYRLPAVMEQLGMRFTNHHNAAADAEACAQIGLGIMSALRVPTLERAAERLAVRVGHSADSRDGCVALSPA